MRLRFARRRHPVDVVLIGLARLPRHLRRRIARILAAPWTARRPSTRWLHAAGLAALGRKEDLRLLAQTEATRGAAGAWSLALAAAVTASRAGRAALDLLDAVEPPASHPARARWSTLVAKAALDARDVRRAEAAIDEAARYRPDDRAVKAVQGRLRRLRSRVEIRASFSRPLTSFKPIPGRVLHLATRSIADHEGGRTIRTHHVVLAQRRAGLEPFVAVLSGRAPAGAQSGAGMDIDGVTYRWLVPGSRVDDRPRPADWAAALVEELRPSALHAATPNALAQLALALRERYGIPVVYEVRGFKYAPHDATIGEGRVTGEVEAAKLAADVASMRDADAVVTLNEGMAREMVSFGVPGDHIFVVPNVVDAEAFAPGPRDPELARRIDAAAGDTVVGYVSTFQAWEDFDTFIKAMGQLHERGVSVRGLLVGAGPQAAAVRRLVESLGLSKVISMPGAVPHHSIPSWYRLIDIFVVPRGLALRSFTVSPLKPVEAMSAGCAVVVSRIPGLMETIREGETGVSYQPGDVGALTEVLATLAQDPARRRRLSENARAWVLAERTLSTNAERFARLYRRLGVLSDVGARDPQP
jgi:glycosyltransferase involved in cell wall biosynthesis